MCVNTNEPPCIEMEERPHRLSTHRPKKERGGLPSTDRDLVLAESRNIWATVPTAARFVRVLEP